MSATHSDLPGSGTGTMYEQEQGWTKNGQRRQQAARDATVFAKCRYCGGLMTDTLTEMAESGIEPECFCLCLNPQPVDRQ